MAKAESYGSGYNNVWQSLFINNGESAEIMSKYQKAKMAAKKISKSSNGNGVKSGENQHRRMIA
jgi:hypothetical protein